jgi:hypothetical protein
MVNSTMLLLEVSVALGPLLDPEVSVEHRQSFRTEQPPWSGTLSALHYTGRPIADATDRDDQADEQLADALAHCAWSHVRAAEPGQHGR